MCRTLQGHGHWVNVLALNTDYVIRMGPYDAKLVQDEDEDEEAKAMAERRYSAHRTRPSA